MADYSQEELHEAAETLVRADEIHNDKDLMKALQAYMKEYHARLGRVSNLKELWEKGKKRAAEEEYKSQFKDKLSNDDDEAQNDADPLAHENLTIAKR